jgi:phenylacetate-CoA ligase
MRDDILALYHRLPAPVRSAAASVRGVYLNLWRYGPGTERLIQAALERETWSPERWDAWRAERLAMVLERAATQVPYYREQWAARRRRGDRAPIDRLESWPILEKDVLREQPRRFVADDCHIGGMYHEQTSGTTGKPLDIWRQRATVGALYALTDARSVRWHGIPPRTRWGRLGGQLVVPVRQRRPPFWVWNAAMRQLYLSTYHLAPDLIPYYLDALARYRVRYLAGYSSSLLALAQEALRRGRRDLRMLAVFTNAEPLREDQRAVISEAFGCPVRETYGMTESVAHASECLKERLHQWPEVGIIEVLQGDRRAPPGESGEFICTGLLNTDMPLIRYRVGDRGRLAPASERCECGRTLPLIAAIDGRNTDILVTRDGRQIFWLNPVFYGLPVRQSQIVQENIDQITVKVAPGLGFSADTAKTIESRLRTRMGDAAITMQVVDEVERTKNGKIQAVVCRLTAEERDAILRGSRGQATAVAR